MTKPGAQQWFSAAELAELALPGLPSTKRGVLDLALREGWASARAEVGSLVRKRAGRGGGLEYHAALLPEAARTKLAARCAQAARPARPDRESAWMRWERLPTSLKDEALRRLEVIDRVDALVKAGMRTSAAVTAVAAEASRDARGLGGAKPYAASTIYGWMQRVAGVRIDDRAVYLAPDYVGRTKTAEIDPRAWAEYKTQWLRQERPTHADVYRWVARTAQAEGWKMASAKTFARRMTAELAQDTEILLRQGPKAARHTFAHADRARPERALQEANLDAHYWDVFCLYEDGEIERPISVAVQDVYSGMPLGIRFDRTVNHHAVRLALADTFEQFGLVDRLTMDNGKENQHRAISGAIPRFRNRAVEEEPPGLLKMLGVEATFTTPYWGQAKPIERMFRDWAHGIAKHPAFAGAYVGHKTDAKPENYRDRAVPIAEFERIVRSELGYYRQQLGRRGRGMNGRSFQQVFDESIAAFPPRRATPEQLRMCLLSSMVVSTDRQSGAVKIQDHRYWSEALSALRRQKVVLRFDPQDLAGRVYVYDLAGKYLCQAERTLQGSWGNQRDGERVTKARRAHIKKIRASTEALGLLDIEVAAARMPQADGTPTTIVSGNVVAPAFGAPRSPEQLGAAAKGQSEFDANWERGLSRVLGGG